MYATAVRSRVPFPGQTKFLYDFGVWVFSMIKNILSVILAFSVHALLSLKVGGIVCQLSEIFNIIVLIKNAR